MNPIWDEVYGPIWDEAHGPIWDEAHGPIWLWGTNRELEAITDNLQKS